jgi:hypothetical protein
MNNVKLGNSPSRSSTRDAIHVAIIPITVEERCNPGDHVSIQKTKNHWTGYEAYNPRKNRHPRHTVGIIDPFKSTPVLPNESTWLVLYPDTVTGMKHHWEHPSFEPQNTESLDVEWMKIQCEELGIEYNDLMAPDHPIKQGEYICTFNNEDAQDHYRTIYNEFWACLERLTNRNYDDTDRGGFSCSC